MATHTSKDPRRGGSPHQGRCAKAPWLQGGGAGSCRGHPHQGTHQGSGRDLQPGLSLHPAALCPRRAPPVCLRNAGTLLPASSHHVPLPLPTHTAGHCAGGAAPERQWWPTPSEAARAACLTSAGPSAGLRELWPQSPAQSTSGAERMARPCPGSRHTMLARGMPASRAPRKSAGTR